MRFRKNMYISAIASKNNLHIRVKQFNFSALEIQKKADNTLYQFPNPRNN